MRYIVVSRSYIRVVNGKEEFYIGSDYWDQLRKAITLAKYMRTHVRQGTKSLKVGE